MIREYRNIIGYEYAGRPFHKSGIAGTRDGELAFLCPVCPRPGVNLPDDWETNTQPR